MKINIKYIFILLLPLLIGSCATMEGLYVGNVEGLELGGMDLKHIDIDIQVPIENPGILRYKVTRLEMDVFLNGVEIGRVVNNEKLVIYGRTDEMYSFPLKLELKGMAATALAMMTFGNTDQLEYRLVGDMSVRVLLLPKKYDIDESGRLDL